ncbi:MAG: CatA-like O-acetyltransferase [Calditrichia bacterium]
MSDYLDIEKWKRREHFHLFKQYDNPFFNMCAEVDISKTITYTQAHELSFFITLLYLSTLVTNEIENFRYRLEEDRVRIYETIHPSSTVLNTDETFSFSYFNYQPGFRAFHTDSMQILKRFKEGHSNVNPEVDRHDLIHYSVIPWVRFTSFSHARRFDETDSIPKIVMGKYESDGLKIMMPVSVEVHHSLMDGLHVGRYFERLQSLLNNPEETLEG